MNKPIEKIWTAILLTAIGLAMLLTADCKCKKETPSAADPLPAVIAKVAGDNVRIREEASSDGSSKILGAVNTGEPLHLYGFKLEQETIGGKKGYWALVYVPAQKIKGWIFSPYINSVPADLQQAVAFTKRDDIYEDDYARNASFWQASGDCKYLYRDTGTSVCYRTFYVYDLSGKTLFNTVYMNYEIESNAAVIITCSGTVGTSPQVQAAIEKLRNSPEYKERQEEKKRLGLAECDEIDVTVKYRFVPEAGEKTFLSCEPY